MDIESQVIIDFEYKDRLFEFLFHILFVQVIYEYYLTFNFFIFMIRITQIVRSLYYNNINYIF